MKYSRNKIVRVFISSTFEDMEKERTILLEKVYPYLLDIYLPLGWQIEFVDLRWGISMEAGVMQKTMRICMEELKRCQQVSARPNFLILQGQRYGWRPLPEVIPCCEWKMILSFLSTNEEKYPNIRYLLEEWYIKDENNVPEVMELVPRHGIYTNDYDEYYKKVESPLVDFFTDFGHSVFLKDRDDDMSKSKYIMSATEQEIMAGALDSKVSPEQVIAYFRNISDIDSYSDENTKYLDSEKNVDYAKKRLEDLRNKIKTKLASNSYSYVNMNVSFKSFESGIYDKEIEEKLKNLLTSIIESEIENFNSQTASPIEKEIDIQDRFITDKVYNFIGRDKELDKLQQAKFGKLTILYGESGIGKSALMSKTFKLMNNGNAENLVIFRSVGIGGMSSGYFILTSIMNQLSFCGIDVNKGKDINFFSLEEVESAFSSFLKNYYDNRHITIFIDAVDQLDSKDVILSDGWIPSAVSDKIRLVISTTNDYSFFSYLKPNVVCLGGLGNGKSSTEIYTSILERVLTDAGRTLTDAQKNAIYEAFKKGGYNPLFLKLISTIATRWKHLDRVRVGDSYKETKEFSGVKDIVIPDNVEALIDGLLKVLMLPENYGLVVSKTLSYIMLSKRGVSDSEIISMLSFDKEFMKFFRKESFHEFNSIAIKLPLIVWTRFYYEIRYFLTTKPVIGGNVLGFYHKQIERGVLKFIADIDKSDVFEIISHHFMEMYNKLSPRILDELPTSLANAGDYDRLFALLTDIDFIQAKVSKGLLFDLLEDYRNAIGSIENKICAADLNLNHITIHDYTTIKYSYYKDTLMSLMKFLLRESYTLLDFAHSYKYWTLQMMGNATKDKFVYRVFERYMSDHYKTDFELYLRENSGANNSEHAIVERLQGHDWCVRDLCVSSDFSKAVSVSDDRSCIVWDLDYGVQKKRIWLHSFQVAFSEADAVCENVISATPKGEVLLWNAILGNILWSSEKTYDCIHCVGISNDGILFAVLGEKEGINMLNVYTIDNFSNVISKKCGSDTRCFCFGGDDIYYVSDGCLYKSATNGDMTYRFENIFEGRIVNKIKIYQSTEIAIFLVDKSEIIAYSLKDYKSCFSCSDKKGMINDFSADSDFKKLVFASGNKLYVWDVFENKMMGVLMGHAKDVTSIIISNDGAKVFSGSRDRRCILWNISEYFQDSEEDMHETFGSCVYMSRPLSDGTVYAGSDTEFLMKWNANDKEGVITDIKSGEVYALDVSADGNKLAWSNGDRLCYLYDIVQKKCREILVGVHDSFINSVRFSKSGRYLIVNAVDIKGSSYGNILSVTDVSDGSLVASYSESDIGVCHPWLNDGISEKPYINTDGMNAMTGRYFYSAIDMTPEKNKYFVIHINSAYATDISPDGTLLAIACRDNTVVVYDLVKKRMFKHLGLSGNGHSNEVKAVAFMPDGKKLISGSWDNSCILWDLCSEDGKEFVRRFTGHIRGVYALDIAPDGKTFISGARDRSCIVWNVEDGTILNIFTTDSSCNSVYFRNNGFIAGFDSGDVIVTKNTLSTILKSIPYVTLHRIWNFKTQEYEEYSYVCPYCGKRIYVADRQINEIKSNAGNIVYPALKMTDVECAVSVTPCCNNKVKLNPYVYDEHFE